MKITVDDEYNPIYIYYDGEDLSLTQNYKEDNIRMNKKTLMKIVELIKESEVLKE